MTLGIEVHLGGLQDVSTYAKSQVTGISGLRAIGYTLGRLLSSHGLKQKHGEFFLPYFKTWIRRFHQNYRVLTNVLGGPTSRFKVEARAGAFRGGGTWCY